MTTAMPGNKARAWAFWAELFNAHDLRNVCGFFAPGFVNHNARPGSRLWAGCSDMVSTWKRRWQKGARSAALARRPGRRRAIFHDISATHRPIAARQIHVLTFNDTGLITEHLAVRDDVTVSGSSARCPRPAQQ